MTSAPPPHDPRRGAQPYGQPPRPHGNQGPPPQQWHHQQPPPPPGYNQQHYAAPPPAPAPAKRRRVWPWVLLGLVAAPILMFGGCVALIGGGTAAVVAADGPVTVRLELTGDGSTASAVTYSNGGDGVSSDQESKVQLPWTKEVTFDSGLMTIPSLIASNDGGGSLTCRITNVETGAVIAESTATGDYAMATCTGPANAQP
ncbi:hypothetical protein [Pseudonocardia sp. NPDC049635]|uniref:hypothetical protein n=1 Tax=Pseudonocardia sp. NPDC049635 TaxID=3155506 RepID=UPI0033F1EC5B